MTNFSIFDFEPTKTTSKARFFAEIEPHLPVNEWLEIISPFYYEKTRVGGRPPKPLEIVLRTFLVQNFFSLSDEAAEDAVCDILSVRKFVGISANDNDIPDASTICRFRALLTKNNLQEALFNQVLSSLEQKGLILKKGSIIDSSIIECSTSKRNKDKAPDKDASWTKKAGNFKHGYKTHINVDADSGLVTANETTTAKVHDVTIANNLLHGNEDNVYGDSAYLNIENHANALEKHKYKIILRRSTVAKMDTNGQAAYKQYHKELASVRAKAEHPFATIKRLFGFKRTHYKGKEKNAAKLNIMFALANIWKVSRLKTA